MKILWIFGGVNTKTGVVLGAISMHVWVFLKVNAHNGNNFWRLLFLVFWGMHDSI